MVEFVIHKLRMLWFYGWVEAWLTMRVLYIRVTSIWDGAAAGEIVVHKRHCALVGVKGDDSHAMCAAPVILLLAVSTMFCTRTVGCLLGLQS